MRFGTLRALAIALGVAAVIAPSLGAGQVRDKGAAMGRGTGAISGTIVTDDDTPLPVRGALVRVDATDAGGSWTAVTDAAGRFAVTALPAGRYIVTATKAPFLRAAFGARRHEGPGTPITLAAGHQMTGLTLRLVRGAVLTGRLTDEAGVPLPGVVVRALQMRLDANGRTFTTPTAGWAADLSDDRGVYRFFGLSPGEYAITAAPRVANDEVQAMTDEEMRAVMQALQQPRLAAGAVAPPTGGVRSVQPGTATASPKVEPDKVTVAYAPVYYPGTAHASGAATVRAVAGDERADLDFSLRPVPTTTVEGVLVLPAGLPPQRVELVMTAKVTPGAGITGLESLVLRTAPSPNGQFMFRAVAPGEYTALARAARTGGAPAARVAAPLEQFWAMADVSVEGAPISGLALTLQPGLEVSGRVEFRSVVTRPGGDLQLAKVSLVPAEPGVGGAWRLPACPHRPSMRLAASPSPVSFRAVID